MANTCQICAERYPEAPACTPGTHRCSICRQQFQLTSKSQRHQHRERPERLLLCHTCRMNGHQLRRKRPWRKAETCSTCAAQFPHLPSREGYHRCWVCGSEYEMHTKYQRYNHKQRPHVPVLCDTCQETGYATHDTQSYRCRNCEMSFGRNRFPSADIRNFKQRKSGRLKCHTCRSGYTCSCCERSFSKDHWTTDQLKKHRSRKTPLRCKDCVASGHARRTLQTR